MQNLDKSNAALGMALGLQPSYDVLVVGGGINGAGIARDLAGRGLSVLLCEKDDLAAHTSSASTKLIHGGLRYLEYYEFGLVRKALAEREVLLKSAPHIMRPLRFVMPHDASMRPAWMIRLGLFLYDHLARREVLAGSHGVDLRTHPAGQPLQQRYTRGFVYSDGWVDDARLVVLNAVDAAARGATIRTYTRCVELGADGPRWRARLQDSHGVASTVYADAVVNAAGPWADRFMRTQLGRSNVRSLRLVRGSHIVLRRLFQHDHAYILQNGDGRIIFAIPYEGEFTLIGTTDVEHGQELDQVRISEDEVDYLCRQASHYFKQALSPADVLWTYSGVRPLLDDEAGNAAAVTRDYRLELDRSGPPLLTVWGGKITTYRKLAEQAADAIADALGRSRHAWTAQAPLPGGDLSPFIGAAQAPDLDFARFLSTLERSHGWLPSRMRERMARAYGTRIMDLLGDARALADLGEMLAPGVYERELDFLRQTEWARSGADVLWRRTKLGLHLSAEQRAVVERWMQQR